MADLLMRLRNPETSPGTYTHGGTLRARAARADMREAAAVIERLRTALKPFAEIALWRDVYPDAKHDELTAQQVRGYIQVEHVRAARAALSDEQKDGES